MTNDLIDQLLVYQTRDDYEGPVASPVVPEQNDAKTTTITTPYCNLYYSSLWTDHLYIEKAEGDDYRVFFYGQLTDKPQRCCLLSFLAVILESKSAQLLENRVRLFQ